MNSFYILSWITVNHCIIFYTFSNNWACSNKWIHWDWAQMQCKFYCCLHFINCRNHDKWWLVLSLPITSASLLLLDHNIRHLRLVFNLNQDFGAMLRLPDDFSSHFHIYKNTNNFDQRQVLKSSPTSHPPGSFKDSTNQAVSSLNEHHLEIK